MFEFSEADQLFDDSECVISDSTFEVREITSIKEKRKWMEYFLKDYSGGTTDFHAMMFGSRCRYFVGVLNGKDAGFIKITDYTDHWSKYYDGQVWNASEAFVKRPYRGQAVLWRLLSHVINHCNVKTVRLELSRLQCFDKYYRLLGFSYAWQIENSDLSIAVLKELEDAARKRNAEAVE